jgi:LPXTG-motif cell wall-anchored protein
MRGGRFALVVPTALLAITAMVSPSFADDVTPGDGGETPAVTETPVPSAEPDPTPEVDPAPEAEAPEPKSEPAAEAKSEPKSAPAPTAGAAFSDAAQARVSLRVQAAAKDDEPDNKKVVVCKYVGTPPGVPHHIIVVSKNAALAAGWTEGQFPGPFADAHDSVAIRWAVGNEQPGDEELGNCPLAEEALPEIPVNDPCGPDNAAYGAVPTGHYTIVRNLDGSITLKADPGYEFPGGTDENVYPAPTDENVPCEPVIIDAPTVPSSDPCGPDNVAYGEVPAGDYDVALNDDGSITLTAHNGYTFADGLTHTYPALVDNGVVCAEGEDEDKVVVCKYVGPPPGVPDHIIVVSKASALNQGWVEGQFPGVFADAQDSVAIRWAIGNEQPGDEELVNCPTEEEPSEIDVPEVPVNDPCDTGNASYGEVPLGDYVITYNQDGSITLEAHEGFHFPGDATMHTYPVLVEENTEACPVVDDTRVVLCTYPDVARASDVLGTVVILDLADLVAHGFAGLFPYEYSDAGATWTAIRFASEGEVAEDIEGVLCGVAGEVEEQPGTEVPGEVGGIVEAAELPNTGGPSGFLVPLGAGLVLAGAALVLARRRETA